MEIYQTLNKIEELAEFKNLYGDVIGSVYCNSCKVHNKLYAKLVELTPRVIFEISDDLNSYDYNSK